MARSIFRRACGWAEDDDSDDGIARHADQTSARMAKAHRSGLKKILLVHGERTPQQALAKVIMRAMASKCCAEKRGNKLQLVNKMDIVNGNLGWIE